MSTVPELDVKFETPTATEGTAFAIGSVAGAGAGLILYTSLPNPNATTNQTITEYQQQISNVASTINSLPPHPPEAQRIVNTSLLKTISSDEEHIQTAIAEHPRAHDQTGKEAGIMLEGTVVGGLILAVASIAIRNLAYRRHQRQAQAFRKSVESSLEDLPVRHKD